MKLIITGASAGALITAFVAVSSGSRKSRRAALSLSIWWN